MPPYPGCPGPFFTSSLLHFLRIYPYFFDIYLCIVFRKLRRWLPPAECPGPSHPPHLLCTPLVSWELDFKVTFMFSNDKPSYERIEMQVIQYFVCSLNCNGDYNIFAS